MARLRTIAVFAAIGGLGAGPAWATGAAPVAIEVVSTPGSEANQAAYTISIMRSGNAPPELTVVQRFAAPVSVLESSSDGQSSDKAITWKLAAPPAEASTLHSTVSFPSAQVPVSTICVDADSTLECAGTTVSAHVTGATVWPRWETWLVAAIAVTSLAGLAYLLHSSHQQWWPGVTRWARRHREGLAISIAALLVCALMLTAAIAGARKVVQAIGQGHSASAGYGPGNLNPLTFGLPTSTKGVEFTLFGWSCTTAQARTCLATVAVRNESDQARRWHPTMQRLYTTAPDWVAPDPDATKTVNAGVDVFEQPLAVGERRLVQVAFAPPQDSRPLRLELRGDAISRGVYMELPSQ